MKFKTNYVTKLLALIFSLILLSFPEASALKIKKFNTNRQNNNQYGENNELNNAIEMEQQLKEILNKYLEQCNYIFIDRGPRVVFDGLLQEINNKFSKSFTFKDLLSNKDHLYFATQDWLPNQLESFNDCKKALFESLQQALKNKIK